MDEEQKERLVNVDASRLTKLSLTPHQERILKTFSPLQKEFKYSKNLLEKTKSLNLGGSVLNFLTQQEIIPDLTTSFQEPKDPYQSLKQEILTKNQKKIRQEIREKNKEQESKELEEVQNSLLPNLIKFAQQNLNNLSSYQYRLTKETFQEKDDWVSIGAIICQQRDFLFAWGFKLTPRYYFFDLLLFVVEKLGQNYQTEENTLFLLETWKNIDLEFTEGLVQEWVKHGFSYQQTKEWIDIGLTINDAEYSYWLANIKQVDADWLLNEGNDEKLRKEYQDWEETKREKIEEYKTQILTILDGWKDNSQGPEKEALRKVIKTLSNEDLSSQEQFNELQTFLAKFPTDNIKFNTLIQAWNKEIDKGNDKSYSSSPNFDYFLKKHPYLKPEWEEYLELLEEKRDQELARRAKFLSSLAGKSGNITGTPVNITSLEEKFERLANNYEKIRSYLVEKEKFFDASETPIAEPQPTPKNSETSPYDELLTGLDKEEQERLRKKKAREEARKKLDEAEFKRRQENLSEKDRKLKEDEEKREKEKKLETQEEEKKRQAKEAREKAIAEDRQNYLSKEEERIDNAKKRAEEELKFQEEQMKKEKEKKEQEIEEAKKKNEQEERKLAEQKELMEKELAEELNKINIADKEGRQRIEEKFKKRKLEIQKEVDELKRKNDDELKEMEANAIKEREENEAKLNKIRNEIRIQEEQGQRAREAAQAQARLLKDQQEKQNDLRKLRNRLYDEVLDYYFNHDEGQAGTENPRKGSGGLREMLDESPSMKFNLHFGDLVDVNRTNYRYSRAIEIFRKVVGNKFVTKGELKNLLEEKVTSLDYMN